jgi:hypothetical protein
MTSPNGEVVGLAVGVLVGTGVDVGRSVAVARGEAEVCRAGAWAG